jgi:lipoprotein signal peptidase
MAGLGLGLVAFLAVGVTGLADFGPGAAVLVFLQYSSQLVAGYLAGRLAVQARVVHGGLAGMIVAAIGAAFGLSSSGSDSNLGLVMLALIIAAITGTAGGVLAENRVRRADGLP